ncbi:hypothetical protein MMC20_007311 [Loxospora ochrophaea]|nr:hypothetical protein [Loxospora ochrophaea]
MSRAAPTSVHTQYADAYEVVIQNLSADPENEWQDLTTFLINTAGHTTAILYATASGSYTPVPIPYTPADAAVANPTSGATVLSGTAGPTGVPTSTATSTPPSKTIIAIGTACGVSALVLVTSLIFFLRRRSLRRRAALRSSKSSDSSILSSPLSPTPQTFNQQPNSTWATFLAEFATEYLHFSSVKSSSDYSSHIGEGQSSTDGETRFKETEALRSERLFRLTDPEYLPPPGYYEADGDTDFKIEDLKLPRPAINGVPKRSILKRPGEMNSEVKVSEVKFESSNTLVEGTTTVPIEGKDQGRVKKGVRFGEDEVRTFGRTPVGSRAASLKDESRT